MTRLGIPKLRNWLLPLALGCGIAAITDAQQAPHEVPGKAVSAVGLQPGDGVKLQIWREPDLSGTYVVDESGDVAFPKIGTVRVTGVSTDSLKRFLVNSYSPFLRDPSVAVTLLRRVTVEGFVRTPGLYQVDATMTLSDVLALAGGAAPDGAPDAVMLVRNGQTVKGKLLGTTTIGNSPLRSGDQLYVPERSWLSRNTGLVAAVVSSVGIVVATVVRP